MKVPNAQAVLVDLDKLRNYSLNPDHDRGKHKARLFFAILGLGVEDAEWLRSVLLEVIQTHSAIPGIQDQYGDRYVIDFPITRNNQTAMVRSAWIIRLTEDFPRLTSCYILR